MDSGQILDSKSYDQAYEPTPQLDSIYLGTLP